MTKNEGAEYRGNQIDKVEKLIEHRDQALNILFFIKEQKQKSIYVEDSAGNNKPLQDLKMELDFLLFNYWPKYKNNYSEKFEIEEELEEKVEDGDPEPNADNLSFQECRQLLYSLSNLMEELGHTKYETDKTGRTTI